MTGRWTISCFRSKGCIVQGAEVRGNSPSRFGQLTRSPTCGTPGLSWSQQTTGNLLHLFPKSSGSWPVQMCTGTGKDHLPQLSPNLQVLSQIQVRFISPMTLVGGPKCILLGGTLTTAGLTWSICPRGSLERHTGVKFRGGGRPAAYEQAKGRLVL